MKLPIYQSGRRRIKLKKCQEPGCEREFWGHPIRKYCDLHSDIKARQKPKKVVDSFEMRNMCFKHNYSETQTVHFKCGL